MKAKKNKEELEVTIGSGNAYADLGYANPQEALAKAELATLITEQIKRKKLTQKQAAQLMEIDQPKVSAIIRGKLSGYSIDRLLRFLMALGVDIVIQATQHTVKTTPPFIHVEYQKNTTNRRLATG